MGVISGMEISYQIIFFSLVYSQLKIFANYTAFVITRALRYYFLGEEKVAISKKDWGRLRDRERQRDRKRERQKDRQTETDRDRGEIKREIERDIYRVS